MPMASTPAGRSGSIGSPARSAGPSRRSSRSHRCPLAMLLRTASQRIARSDRMSAAEPCGGGRGECSGHRTRARIGMRQRGLISTSGD
eukprot:2145083-Prymnesium_polylepis.1